MKAIVVLCALTFGSVCEAAAEQGLASFYGIGRAGDLTAAHRTLPMGARVRILNLDNGRVTVVRIIDRGPFIRGRIIDVSRAAASTLGFQEAGLAHVKIVPIREETAATEPRPEAQAKPAAHETSVYEICRYGADGLNRLRGDFVGDSNKLECKSFRTRLLSLASDADDGPAGAAAAVASNPANGLAAATSIPVSALTEVIAAESISVSALLPPREPVASLTREPDGCGSVPPCKKPGRLPAGKPALSLLARLSRLFD